MSSDTVVFVIERYGDEYEILPGVVTAEEGGLFSVFILATHHRYLGVFNKVFDSLAAAKASVLCSGCVV